MLNFKGTWSKPIELIDGAHENLTYTLAKMSSLPTGPGAYVFAREHGGKKGGTVTPLYIGETTNIRVRIGQHFKNHVRLMNGIRSAPKGRRILLYCTIRTNSEGRRDSMLEILQRGLIEHALSQGHKLLNVSLTKVALHSVRFTGNWTTEQLAPRLVYVRGL